MPEGRCAEGGGGSSAIAPRPSLPSGPSERVARCRPSLCATLPGTSHAPPERAPTHPAHALRRPGLRAGGRPRLPAGRAGGAAGGVAGEEGAARGGGSGGGHPAGEPGPQAAAGAAGECARVFQALSRGMGARSGSLAPPTQLPQLPQLKSSLPSGMPSCRRRWSGRAQRWRRARRRCGTACATRQSCRTAPVGGAS